MTARVQSNTTSYAAPVTQTTTSRWVAGRMKPSATGDRFVEAAQARPATTPGASAAQSSGRKPATRLTPPIVERGSRRLATSPTSPRLAPGPNRAPGRRATSCRARRCRSVASSPPIIAPGVARSLRLGVRLRRVEGGRVGDGRAPRPPDPRRPRRLAAPHATLLAVENARPSSETLPGDRVLERLAAAQVQREPQDAPVPADPDGARPELVPHLLGHDRDVLELEAGRPLVDLRQPDLDLGDVGRVGDARRRPTSPSVDSAARRRRSRRRHCPRTGSGRRAGSRR